MIGSRRNNPCPMVTPVLNNNLSDKLMGSSLAFTSVKLQSWLEQAMDPQALASNFTGRYRRDSQEALDRLEMERVLGKTRSVNATHTYLGARVCTIK